METHIKVLGWLFIVMNALGLFIALIVFLIVGGAGLVSGDRNAMIITSLVAIVVALTLLVLSLPGLIAGIGLLKFKPWARILALVLGILNLPFFPTGTILGVYSLVVLLNDEATRLFNGRAAEISYAQ
jgi:hypothetical protein